ncbi:hypothetical protein V5799_007535 [Amblyomma americanum]|uniref:Uncharacterized protein n=1 Tax=Amblyomma americanum TaxID=6943 RepID=A0AAQ4FFY9_AMBAM
MLSFMFSPVTAEANTNPEGVTSGQKNAHRPPAVVKKRPLLGTLAAFFLVVGVGAVVSAFVLGAFVSIHIGRVDDEMLCRTAECKAAAAYLRKLLVTGHHPCANFYGRVCGSLIEGRTGFHEENVLAALRTMNASMFVLDETLDPEDVRLGKHILKPLYKNCFRYMSTETDLRKELAQAKAAISIDELVQATSFVGIVRYLVRTALRVGNFALFDVRFVRMGNQSLLQLRRGYSLRGKVGASVEDTDLRYRITKLLNIWLGRDNVSAETETLLRLDHEQVRFRSLAAQVMKIISKSVPQVLRPLEDVTSGMMNLTSEEWAAAVNEAHNEPQLKLQPSDTVIDTDMVSVHNASTFLVDEGVNVTAFYLATNLAADVIFLVHTKLASLLFSFSAGSSSGVTVGIPG